MAAITHFHSSNEGEDPSKAMDAMREMMGPGHVDQMIRGAIQQCWMILPKDRRNADEVARQLQRILDRAIANLREDAEAFGVS